MVVFEQGGIGVQPGPARYVGIEIEPLLDGLVAGVDGRVEDLALLRVKLGQAVQLVVVMEEEADGEAQVQVQLVPIQQQVRRGGDVGSAGAHQGGIEGHVRLQVHQGTHVFPEHGAEGAGEGEDRLAQVLAVCGVLSEAQAQAGVIEETAGFHAQGAGPDFQIQGVVHLVQNGIAENREGVLGADAQVSGIEAHLSPVPAVAAVHAGADQQVAAGESFALVAFQVVHGGGHPVTLGLDGPPVAEEAAHRAVQAHLEGAVQDGAEDDIGLGTEGITGTGPDIEFVPREAFALGFHVHQVGAEFIGALVGIPEDGVVEVRIEPEQRIRHVHRNGSLVDIQVLAFVGAGHLYGRIQVLGLEGGAGTQGGHRQDISLVHHCSLIF